MGTLMSVVDSVVKMSVSMVIGTSERTIVLVVSRRSR